MKKFPGKTRRRAEKADRGSARPSSSRQTPGHLSSKEDQRRPRFSKELSVLYEDDALVIVDKPAGLLAVPVEGSDAPSALSLLIAKLQPKRQRALIVHRIDRFASGALLFAKTASDREALVRQFLAHTPMRRYLAVVRGRIVDRTGAQTGARTGTAVHYFRREGMYQQLRTARDPRATRAEMRYSVERLFADAFAGAGGAGDGIAESDPGAIFGDGASCDWRSKIPSRGSGGTADCAGCAACRTS